MEHGLVVTTIYQVLQYWPDSCFAQFGEDVSNARRAGDRDPDKAVIADTMKLLGNSGYGKTVTNKQKHRDVKYCDDVSSKGRTAQPPFPVPSRCSTGSDVTTSDVTMMT